MNKTAISSVVCLDIIDFSKKSKPEQQEIKKQFHTLIDHGVVDIPKKDCMVVDTENGAIIACSGPLESALEDALFIALTIRDEILNTNTGSETPLYLLMGINLGSVSVDKKTKSDETPKVVGEGLFEAQQIMSFANPNQILVSRAYYDMASKLTLEVAEMFEKYDMHAYEHDIYAVRRLTEKVTVGNAAAALDHLEKPQEEIVKRSTLNWSVYVLPLLLALIMLFILIKWMWSDEAVNVKNSSDLGSSTSEEMRENNVDILPDPLPEIVFEEEAEGKGSQEKMGKGTSKAVKKKTVKQVPASERKEEAKPAVADPVVERPVANPAKPKSDADKSAWDTIKDSVTTGTEHECTQAEIALNQCSK